ncbi:MAG: acyl-CoA dehydrogenase family protein [Acetobacteraceae bacterium]|nr:acyl-CoA dehydrogenase family protein [Acetobacteraceae bacterium]
MAELIPPSTRLPPELDLVRQSVFRLVRDEILPAIGRLEREGTFPRALIARMGAAGCFGATFPEAVGGSDLGFAAVAVIAEEISRTRPDFGYCMNLQAMTCPFTILNWGTADQIARFVPDLIAGRKIGMFGLTEPGGGSDPAGAMRSTARRDGDSYRLNGSKQWITFAHEADTGVLFARTDAAAGARGITAFIIQPKESPGYHARPIAMRNLSPILASCTVSLDDFVVPDANRLGAEGEGFRIALNALEFGRLTVASRQVGLAQACLEHGIAYAREREVGGRPIGRYQLVQGLIADLAVEVHAARLLVAELAATMDAGEPANRIASHAKYFASRTAKNAASAAREIFAGYALADEYPISFLAGFIDMLAVGEGTANVQRVLIAEDALGFKDANRASLPARKFRNGAA